MCTGQQCLPQGQGLWVQQTWVWHRPHHRAPRTYIGLGKQILGGHKQNLMHTRIQEKGAETPQETDPDLPESAQGPSAEAWVSCGLWQCRGHWDLLKEVSIVFITSTIVWSQVRQQRGPQSRPSTESCVDRHLIFIRSKHF